MPAELPNCRTAELPDCLRPDTVGRPLPGRQVAVMDPQGRILPAGATGEVVVRGPHVMRGYLSRPEETANAPSTHRK
ncbi:AMP-binding protein [Streptomyces sp. NPDC048434]|uniref:AMP-binding protein n=1 Tax=Streptomyces sp. NPDC048434 TaxID=3365549 RepID=UPI00371152EA